MDLRTAWDDVVEDLDSTPEEKDYCDLAGELRYKDEALSNRGSTD